MQNTGFMEYLEEQKLDSDMMKKSLKIVTNFTLFLIRNEKTINTVEIEDVHNFSAILIEKEKNTYDNYLALLRYGLFNGIETIIIPIMELLDGREMFPNFSKRLIDEYDEDVRNEVFRDIEIPPLGLHPKKRPAYAKKLVNRFIQKFGEEKSVKFFAIGLRDKYTESYKQSREDYLKASNIDDFLFQKRLKFLKTLKKHNTDNSLFFTQKIDTSVIDYVKNDPTIESGVRDGKTVNITKIPYMSLPYLNATSKKKKAYYFCHNPMIREALLDEEQPVSPIFCNCSGGYYKNFWEAVLDQTVAVELIESVIMGDNVCRFALHLPDSVLEKLLD